MSTCVLLELSVPLEGVLRHIRIPLGNFVACSPCAIFLYARNESFHSSNLYPPLRFFSVVCDCALLRS
ncbi:hypothetical protein ABG067_007128 [Albugo candida]